VLGDDGLYRGRSTNRRRAEVELVCFVEVPKGSRNKYEYDERHGVLKLDRHLFSSVVFPADYGFLEETLVDRSGRHLELDDRLDALVLVSEPTFPGCRIDVRPIGVFQMRDEAGVDDKVLCVPLHDPEWRDVHELEDVSARIRDEIAHFFSVYKELEPERLTAIEGWAGREAAEQEIEEAQTRYRAVQG
jgi:inorganic pyrophosphatase